MYIFGFFKAVFKKRNLLSTLFFLINLVVVFFLSAQVLTPFFRRSSFMYNLYFNTGIRFHYLVGIFGLVLNAILFLIFLSPIGEFFVIKSAGGVRAKNEDLIDLFNSVIEESRKIDSKLSKNIKLYIINDKNNINAFATGKSTVGVTIKALEELDQDQLSGIFAHEIGHLSSKDSYIPLAVYSSNLIILGIVLFVKIIITALQLILLFARKIEFLNILIGSIIKSALTFLTFLWVRIGMLFLNHSSRLNEYAADEFAVRIGFADGLHSALSTIDPNSYKRGVLSELQSTHPITSDRLDRIVKVHSSIQEGTDVEKETILEQNVAVEPIIPVVSTKNPSPAPAFISKSKPSKKKKINLPSCQSCGTALNDGEHFCTNCGSPRE